MAKLMARRCRRRNESRRPRMGNHRRGLGRMQQLRRGDVRRRRGRGRRDQSGGPGRGAAVQCVDGVPLGALVRGVGHVRAVRLHGLGGGVHGERRVRGGIVLRADADVHGGRDGHEWSALLERRQLRDGPPVRPGGVVRRMPGRGARRRGHVLHDERRLSRGPRVQRRHVPAARPWHAAFRCCGVARRDLHGRPFATDEGVLPRAHGHERRGLLSPALPERRPQRQRQDLPLGAPDAGVGPARVRRRPAVLYRSGEHRGRVQHVPDGLLPVQRRGGYRRDAEGQERRPVHRHHHASKADAARIQLGRHDGPQRVHLQQLDGRAARDGRAADAGSHLRRRAREHRARRVAEADHAAGRPDVAPRDDCAYGTPLLPRSGPSTSRSATG